MAELLWLKIPNMPLPLRDRSAAFLIQAIFLVLLTSLYNPRSAGAQSAFHPFERAEPALRAAAGAAFDPRLEPFYHGVASGDPTADGIILWTRVSVTEIQSVEVEWEIAPDTAFSSIIQSGVLSTDTAQDYTVKVPLSGLASGHTYYYRFKALGNYSITGRTRTADQNPEQLRFAVVSCNSYPAGYFNAFGRIAERNDLDAVIHLGDFIYEYGESSTPGPAGAERNVIEPKHEILSLEDYRQRYAWYRLDADLRRAMQQHPFIFVWDDHESANNSWTGGAENHDPLSEGSWPLRKRRASRVYFEWTPIRDDPNYSIYRSFSFGPLAELIMLDTRLEGREEQVYDHLDPIIWDPDRTILGPFQFEWFTDKLKNSTAQWKLIGNQVLFSPVILENFETIYPGVQDEFLDVWMGYPQEREKILDTMQLHNINNVVFATGDIHIAAACDVPRWDGDSLYYNATTAEGSLAVEFVGTSISSNNFDEQVGVFLAGLVEDLFLDENPHGKYGDFIRHGYFVMDVSSARTQADYFYVRSKLEPDREESFDEGWFTLNGENRLQAAGAPAPPKSQQEIPAPDPTLSSTGLAGAPALFLWQSWPNPLQGQQVFVAISLNRPEQLSIRLIDPGSGRVHTLEQRQLQAGHYTLQLDLPPLSAPAAILELSIPGQLVRSKLMKL